MAGRGVSPLWRGRAGSSRRRGGASWTVRRKPDVVGLPGTGRAKVIRSTNPTTWEEGMWRQ
jgi:hypothetical protein